MSVLVSACKHRQFMPVLAFTDHLLELEPVILVDIMILQLLLFTYLERGSRIRCRWPVLVNIAVIVIPYLTFTDHLISIPSSSMTTK